MSTEKRRKTRKSANSFGPEVDDFLRGVAKEAAGKPLSDSLKAGSGSLLAQLIGRVAELALDAEMTDHLGYERHDRLSLEQAEAHGAPRRPNTRNGFSEKTLKTTHGETTIAVPRDRDATFAPKIIPRRKTVAEELEQRVIALYTQGMTTRDICTGSP